MKPEILLAVISGFTILASALVSVLVTSRRDLKARNRDLFGAQLIPRRYKYYPELNQVLSGFIKELRPPGASGSDPVSVDTFRRIGKVVFDWDSKHSYLMSGRCSGRMFEYYNMLGEYLLLPDDVLVDKLRESSVLERILWQTCDLESSMRSDLGIFDLEFLGINEFYPSARSLGGLRMKLYCFLNESSKRFPRIVTLKKQLFPSFSPVQMLIRK